MQLTVSKVWDYGLVAVTTASDNLNLALKNWKIQACAKLLTIKSSSVQIIHVQRMRLRSNSTTVSEEEGGSRNMSSKLLLQYTHLKTDHLNQPKSH